VVLVPEASSDPARGTQAPASPPPAAGEQQGAESQRSARIQPAPRATYRIQLTPAFGFRQLQACVPYLARLGISHVYVSPCLEAVPGSSHGYDVTDPGRVRQDFGGEPARAAAFEACRRLGLGVLLDIVPNHMAASARSNPWWRDLLHWGRASPFASYFDVDWTRHDGRVLLPILSGSRSAGAADEMRLELGSEGLELWVQDHVLPVAARSLGLVLAELSAEAAPELWRRLQRLELDVNCETASHRERVASERALVDCLVDETRRELVSELLQRLNLAPERLRTVLEAQHYRLQFWRAGLDEINYRRFFDISELAALRVEDPGVFDAVHVQIRAWLARGEVAGLRVDHPDGLKDPEQYFERLRALPGASWVVVEKVLAAGERLPVSFPVDGTTGYDFLNVAARLFVDPGAEHALTRAYCRLAELPSYDVQRAVRAAKARALRELFGAEVAALTARALPACQAERGRAFGAGDVQRALVALITALPVYRTYLRPARAASETDVAWLEAARRHAVTEHPELAPLVGRLVELLIGAGSSSRNDEFATAFQQLSGPAMAKGLEDTVLYDDARLLALNEVGGDPGRFGGSVEEFHEYCRHLQAHWPRTLLASSTHDTKRSEDARLRIALLSELPLDWAHFAESWMQRSRALPGGGSLDPRTLYFMLQTLIGVWPISLERLRTYLLKAVREAKAWTSWLSPDLPREAALVEFTAALLQHPEFSAEIASFVRRLQPAFERHSLALSVLKLGAPGVPDIYQGTELWDFSLADPDNRRPVDFALRESLLDGFASLTDASQPPGGRLGEAKLWVIAQALRLRRERPECFDARGAYTPLQVEGDERQRVVAFQRGADVLCVAPRLTFGLEGWGDTRVRLPRGRFVDVFSGCSPDSGHLQVVLERFPVALLVRS
jgi:(1->4)-alpha-D-glucan 1-alpha-D-glucosylmutase